MLRLHRCPQALEEKPRYSSPPTIPKDTFSFQAGQGWLISFLSFFFFFFFLNIFLFFQRALEENTWLWSGVGVPSLPCTSLTQYPLPVLSMGKERGTELLQLIAQTPRVPGSRRGQNPCPGWQLGAGSRATALGHFGARVAAVVVASPKWGRAPGSSCQLSLTPGKSGVKPHRSIELAPAREVDIGGEESSARCVGDEDVRAAKTTGARIPRAGPRRQMFSCAW